VYANFYARQQQFLARADGLEPKKFADYRYVDIFRKHVSKEQQDEFKTRWCAKDREVGNSSDGSRPSTTSQVAALPESVVAVSAGQKQTSVASADAATSCGLDDKAADKPASGDALVASMDNASKDPGAPRDVISSVAEAQEQSSRFCYDRGLSEAKQAPEEPEEMVQRPPARALARRKPTGARKEKAVPTDIGDN
jgi:hypothetical protein